MTRSLEWQIKISVRANNYYKLVIFDEIVIRILYSLQVNVCTNSAVAHRIGKS